MNGTERERQTWPSNSPYGNVTALKNDPTKILALGSKLSSAHRWSVIFLEISIQFHIGIIISYT
jgi:hypothetical protein